MPICRKCGNFSLGLTVQEGTCLTCREGPDFGTPLQLSARLSMLAQAQRASSGQASLICLADGCKNQAREWWYVCSRECRDRLVQSYLTPDR